VLPDVIEWEIEEGLYRFSDIGISIELWYFRMFHRRRGLRMWILSILASSPKNGAEIMDEIEEMSQGWWRPSPGSIYPLLNELEKDGYVKKLEDGRYELTEKSKSEIGWSPWIRGRRAYKIEDLINEFDSFVSYMEDIARSDRQKIEPYMERLVGLSNRLSMLSKKEG
jgi:DNA-binding PadR family transcriptional regulator